MTLPAAETKWPELLVILSKTVDGIDITEDEASAFSFSEKARLIRTDAITCARYFDFRFRQLFSLMKSKKGVFGENVVEKYYWRIEFQQRCSPHIHGMYWLKNAPILNLADESTFQPVINVIDQFIMTSGGSDLGNLISYQRHKHSRSCQRELRGKRICRFEMPCPPMPGTCILFPLEEDFPQRNVMEIEYQKIVDYLNRRMSSEIEAELDDFQKVLGPEGLNMTIENYKTCYTV